MGEDRRLAGSAEAKQMIREAVERYDNAKESEKNPTPVGQENA